MVRTSAKKHFSRAREQGGTRAAQPRALRARTVSACSGGSGRCCTTSCSKGKYLPLVPGWKKTGRTPVVPKTPRPGWLLLPRAETGRRAQSEGPCGSPGQFPSSRPGAGPGAAAACRYPPAPREPGGVVSQPLAPFGAAALPEARCAAASRGSSSHEPTGFSAGLAANEPLSSLPSAFGQSRYRGVPKTPLLTHERPAGPRGRTAAGKLPPRSQRRRGGSITSAGLDRQVRGEAELRSGTGPAEPGLTPPSRRLSYSVSAAVSNPSRPGCPARTKSAFVSARAHTTEGRYLISGVFQTAAPFPAAAGAGAPAARGGAPVPGCHSSLLPGLFSSQLPVLLQVDRIAASRD